MRNGTRLDGKKHGAAHVGPDSAHLGMSDEDLDALVAYMKTLPRGQAQAAERELVEPLRAQLGS